MPSRTLEANRKSTAKHYAENKQYYLDRNKARLEVFRSVIEQAKSVPCADCKVQYASYVMDFDHITGVKKFNIGCVSAIPSLKALHEEIAKCEVVCSNCHRVRTFTRNGLVV